MYVGPERGEPIGKARGVGQHRAIGTAAGGLPTIVEVHVLIAGGVQAAGYERIGIGTELRLVERWAASERVPAIPTHGGQRPRSATFPGRALISCGMQRVGQDGR